MADNVIRNRRDEYRLVTILDCRALVVRVVILSGLASKPTFFIDGSISDCDDLWNIVQRCTTNLCRWHGAGPAIVLVLWKTATSRKQH